MPVRVLLAVLPVVAVSGCALMPKPDAAVDAATPLAIDVTDRAAFERDLTALVTGCRAIAAASSRPFDAGAITSKGVHGAGANAAGAAATPIVPALGAIGEAGGEALDQWDPFGTVKLGVLWNCMRERGRASGLYKIVDEPH